MSTRMSSGGLRHAVAALALATFSVLAIAGCGHAPVPVSPPRHIDTPDGRLAACLAAAGYNHPSTGFSIRKELEHAQLIAGAMVRDGRADRQVVVYRADADGRVAALGAAMTSSGMRVAAIAGRRLVGVSDGWSPGPRRSVLKRCAVVAVRGRSAPAGTAWF